MHLYGIFDLMRVMCKWGHPQLAVCPRFPWQNQMCVPDLHLQMHTHTPTCKTCEPGICTHMKSVLTMQSGMCVL